MLLTLASLFVIAYVGVFALLFAFQRDFLFIGSRDRAALPPSEGIYTARTLTEADGTRLTIWRAPSAQSGRGTVVFFYGNGGIVTDFANVGEALHRDGFGIVLATYRGYSGSTGHPTESGLMDDARSILATVPRHEGPVVLWGQSLGSGIAARMITEGRGDALILQSPYTSVVDVAALRFPIYPVRWFMKDRFDTASLLPKIKVPVLILHGTVDGTVPFTMGAELARRLGDKATFVPIPGRGHNDLDDAILVRTASPWLDAHSMALGQAPILSAR